MGNTWAYLQPNIDSYRYTFDASTNRQRWQKNHGGANPFTTTFDDTVNYDYDANDRIESETTTGTNPKTVTYEFGDGVTANFVGDATNQTKKVETVGTTETTTLYTYNEMGRLKEVKIEVRVSGTLNSTTTETYTYNHAGLRVTTTANGTTTTYLFDTTNPTGYAQVLEETVGSTLNKTYTLGLDVIAQATTGQLLTLLYDAHGSTRMLLDTAASVVLNAGTPQVFSYDAYGNSLGFDPSVSLTTLLYSGEWVNGAHGKQYLRGRWYQPNTGQFLRRDPYAGHSRLPRDYQAYLYSRADPINRIDPSGNLSLSELGVAVSIGAFVASLGAGASVAVGGSASQALRTAIYGGLGGFAIGLAIPLGRAPQVAVGGIWSGILNALVDTIGDQLRILQGKTPIGGPPSKPKYIESLFKGFAIGSYQTYIETRSPLLEAVGAAGFAAGGDIVDEILSNGVQNIDWNKVTRTFVVNATIGFLIDDRVLDKLPAMQGRSSEEAVELLQIFTASSLSVLIGLHLNVWLK